MFLRNLVEKGVVAMEDSKNLFKVKHDLNNVTKSYCMEFYFQIDNNGSQQGYDFRLTRFVLELIIGTVIHMISNFALGCRIFWCEAFSTYPRTYDHLHLDGLFAYESQRCEMNNVMLVMEAATVLIQMRIDWVTEKKEIRDRETLFVPLIKLLLLFNDHSATYARIQLT